MRTWQRSPVEAICGGPCKGTTIRVGDPVQMVELVGVARKLVRCRNCADGQPPSDLPTLQAQTAIQSTMLTRFTAGSLPLDWKRAAAGREVGSDDE